MGKRIEKGINDFSTWCIKNNHQEMITEWNIEKNGGTTPDTVGFGSNTKVWWIGKCGHEWLVSPSYRVIHSTGCP